MEYTNPAGVSYGGPYPAVGLFPGVPWPAPGSCPRPYPVSAVFAEVVYPGAGFVAVVAVVVVEAVSAGPGVVSVVVSVSVIVSPSIITFIVNIIGVLFITFASTCTLIVPVYVSSAGMLSVHCVMLTCDKGKSSVKYCTSLGYVTSKVAPVMLTVPVFCNAMS